MGVRFVGGGVIGVGGRGVEELGERVENELVVLFGAELRDVEEEFFARGGGAGEGGGVDDLFDGDGGEDGGDWGFLVELAVRGPEVRDVGSSPGGVRHYDVEGAASEDVEAHERSPVGCFCEASQSFAGSGVDTLTGVGGQGVNHVGADEGVVHVGACGYLGEERLAECRAEGVAHGINEDVWDQE